MFWPQMSSEFFTLLFFSLYSLVTFVTLSQVKKKKKKKTYLMCPLIPKSDRTQLPKFQSLSSSLHRCEDIFFLSLVKTKEHKIEATTYHLSLCLGPPVAVSWFFFFFFFFLDARAFSFSFFFIFSLSHRRLVSSHGKQDTHRGSDSLISNQLIASVQVKDSITLAFFSLLSRLSSFIFFFFFLLSKRLFLLFFSLLSYSVRRNTRRHRLLKRFKVCVSCNIQNTLQQKTADLMTDG